MTKIGNNHEEQVDHGDEAHNEEERLDHVVAYAIGEIYVKITLRSDEDNECERYPNKYREHH